MTFVIAFLSAALMSWLASIYLVKPVRFIWETVLHIAPDAANTPAPDPKKVLVGREFVTTLAANIYQIANVADNVKKLASKTQNNLKSEFVANSLTMPLVVLDKEVNIIFANKALLEYVSRTEEDTIGQNVYTVLDFMFSNDNTFDSWLEQARSNKVTATKTWERVRLNLSEQKLPDHYCDLVAYYNKNNPEGFEIMLMLFDRTRQYSQDEQAMSFVALMAHEIRTPLTLLRGYIDAFEEELDGKLDPEMIDFMYKMKVAAQQLAAFTTNILNVTRFENNQLTLKLREENLAPILQQAVSNMELGAQVHGIKLTLSVDDKLPTVGADSVSIDEVVSNLIDNAIKYSGNSKEIVIHAYLTSSGLVETTVKDFGVGVPESAMSSLFEKFYRDYHNRNQVGGTGMGLYLSKAIIDAHGGNIWVQSKEGQGSTFGFTLTPYSQLADEAKKGDNNTDITRTAHGWIKNHSLYRR
jgi:signal transduction histidine kinase